MTLMYRWLLISLLAGFAAYGAAEEADKPEPAADAVPAPAAAGEAGPSSSSSKRPDGGKPTAEVFVPTEEISEDFAVSFPVDI